MYLLKVCAYITPQKSHIVAHNLLFFMHIFRRTKVIETVVTSCSLQTRSLGCWVSAYLIQAFLIFDLFLAIGSLMYSSFLI